MIRVLLAALAAALAFSTPPVRAATEPMSAEKEQDIRKLMDYAGATRFAQMMARGLSAQISQAVKQRKPDAPEETYTMIANEVGSTIKEEISVKGGYTDQIIPIFHKYLTHEDIKGLLAFYNTPLGKKAVAALPMIAQESLPLQQKWVQGFAPKLQARLKAKFAERGISFDAPPPGGAAPAPAPAPAPKEGGNGKAKP